MYARWSAPLAGGDLQHGLSDLLRGEGGPQGLNELLDVDALPLGVGRDRLRAEFGRRRQRGQHRDELDAKPRPFRLERGVAGDESDGGLGPRVAATERRAVDRRAAGDRDHGAAGRQRAPQRVADPVECLRYIDIPVLAEGLPGLLLQWAHLRCRPGAEHHRARLVLVDQPAVRYAGSAASAATAVKSASSPRNVSSSGTVAGDADDACPGCRKGGGDAAAESATGAGDDRCGAGQGVVGLVHIESDTHHRRDSSVHPR